jgi:hypothetical protein
MAKNRQHLPPPTLGMTAAATGSSNPTAAAVASSGPPPYNHHIHSHGMHNVPIIMNNNNHHQGHHHSLSAGLQPIAASNHHHGHHQHHQQQHSQALAQVMITNFSPILIVQNCFLKSVLANKTKNLSITIFEHHQNCCSSYICFKAATNINILKILLILVKITGPQNCEQRLYFSTCDGLID